MHSAASLLDDIRNTHFDTGAALWWLGQMGYVIKIRNTTLLVDGFLHPRPDRLVPPAFDPAMADCFDGILGSHDHDDHIDHWAWRRLAQSCPRAVFAASGLHRASVCGNAGLAPDRFLALEPGKTYMINDVSVQAIPAAHEFLDRDAATGLYPHLSFIIDGKIFHAGDSLVYEGQRALLREFGPLAAMILPINGRDARRYRSGCIGNMTFQEAVDLAGEMRPGAAIPGHWDMFAGNTADPNDFQDYLAAKYPGVPCLIPRRGQRFHLEY